LSPHQTIDDLVNRAIPAGGDYQLPALFSGLLAQALGMPWPLGEDEVKIETLLVEHRLDLG
jgi:hypothetical protein